MEGCLLPEKCFEPGLNLSFLLSSFSFTIRLDYHPTLPGFLNSSGFSDNELRYAFSVILTLIVLTV